MDKKKVIDVLKNLANGVDPETGLGNASGIPVSPMVVRALFNAVLLLEGEGDSHTKKDHRIEFYRTTGQYGFLSNFSKYPIFLDEKGWPTVEHYFQAKKFESEAVQEEIRQALTAKDAANLGRDRRKPIKQDWEDIKLYVMKEALRAKFGQHENLRQKLLATGCAELVEHTKNDRFWGDAGDGSGDNMLGKLLMEVREEVKGDNLVCAIIHERGSSK